ncbi:MAG: DUF4830 domain-containing protein [Ruminococcaceae bacterium]|nr:DUF4830 domain-containing protein [Oscillospiraceae bacterium]
MKKMYLLTVITIILITVLFLFFYRDEGTVCVNYLNNMGYKTEKEPAMTEEYLIPKNFDSALYDYNLMQISAGFDLSKYKGKRAVRYTYKITNLPDIELYANLTLAKGHIIAADLINPKLDGFLLPMIHRSDFIKNHIPANTDAVTP